MLVSGGKILALGKVFRNESLVGSGTPDHPLGMNTEWLQDYIASAGDTIPYSGVEPIRIDDHRVSFNSAGFASESWVQEQKYAPSAWVDKHYAKKTDLDPYVLKSFLEDNYYDKNTIDDKLSKLGGYKVVNGKPDTHEPDYEGDDKEKYIFLTQDPDATGPDVYFEWIWLEDSWKCIGETSMDLNGYATETWVNEQGFLKEDALQPYATTEWVNANFSGKDALDEEFAKYYTKNETSAASAIDAEFAKYQLSGDYITSEEAATTYIQKTWSADKDFTPYSGGEGIKVENHIISLSAVPQNIEITSHDESVNVSSATDPQTGITTYDLTVPTPTAEVNISGEHGVSAKYDEAASAWLVGLEEEKPATYMETQSTITSLTADAKTILSGFGINTQIYGSDIKVTTDTVILEKGMYHIDLQIDVTVLGNDPAYYTTTIKPTISNAVLTQIIDGSYKHTETLDLSFVVDVAQAVSSSALQFELEGLPAGASYVVKNLQVCEIITVDTELQSQGGAYTGGDAIAIDAQNKINVKYNSASGIGLDENGQLRVKLGKGLKFDDSEGAVEGTLILDDVTEQVVETVTDLKQELDSKLTVNFNYPQITDNNYDFGSLKVGDTCICQLFAVSLQHEIIENRTVFSVYVKDTGYSQANVILGIFEYDFDGNGGTGTTNWVCDTGPVSLGKQTTHDKLEFPVTHVNPDRHVLRSDRAYYAVLAMKADGGTGIFLASCPGYSPLVNSNPTLNWRYDNASGLDFVNPSGSLANTRWWESGYNEKNDMNRFFLQIRNKAEV